MPRLNQWWFGDKSPNKTNVAAQLRSLPADVRHALHQRSAAGENLFDGPLDEALTVLNQRPKAGREHVNSLDGPLRAYAERRADGTKRLLESLPTTVTNDPHTTYSHLAAHCASYGITPPAPAPDGGDPWPRIRRMLCRNWWYRATRRAAFIAREGSAVAIGIVHSGGQCYCSDRTVRAYLRDQQRQADYLAQAQALNLHTGETITLSAIAKGSQSNPAVRKAEMMVKLRGLDDLAEANDLAIYFVTVTCPSAYHSVIKASGRRNPRYQYHTPEDGHQWLLVRWARVRAKLAREGINILGCRVAEPNHDGTAHHHLAVLVAKPHSYRLQQVMAAHFMLDTPRADMHSLSLKAIKRLSGLSKPEARVKTLRVWSEKKDGKRIGGIAAYLAKYISKNTDGDDILEDLEGNPGEDAAVRVRAWSRGWRIRQFQFFGTPCQWLWRALRKHKELPIDDPQLAKARDAADEGRYADFVLAIRQARTLPKQIKRPKTDRYGDIVTRVIALTIGPIIQLKEQWRILPPAQQSHDTLHTILPRDDFNLLATAVGEGTHAPPSGALGLV